jgi:hypothetical protein
MESFWNYTVGVIKAVKTLFKKCHSWSNVLMAYGLVFFFFQQNNMFILILQSEWRINGAR